MFEEDLSIEQGAVIPWRRQNEDDGDGYYAQILRAVCKQFAIPMRVAVKELSLKQREIILWGTPKKGDKIRIDYTNSEGQERYYETGFSGVVPNLQRRYQETTSEYIRSKLEEYMSVHPCPTCNGRRLRPEALAVTVADKNIWEVTRMPVDDTWAWVRWLQGEGELGPQAAGCSGAAGRMARAPMATAPSAPPSHRCRLAPPLPLRPVSAPSRTRCSRRSRRGSASW